MRIRMSKLVKMIPIRAQESRGVTGLETAIVLIAFVVVSSVFAFASLSTGLFSADKSKETINAGLSEARGTLELRGSVIARAPTTTGDAGIIDFFIRCKEMCDEGRTIIPVVHSYAFDEAMLIRIRSLCDAHLKLRLEEIGDRLVKMLEVSKIRNAERTTGNIISFDVEPGMGMRIIPVNKAKA